MKNKKCKENCPSQDASVQRETMGTERKECKKNVIDTLDSEPDFDKKLRSS